MESANSLFSISSFRASSLASISAYCTDSEATWPIRATSSKAAANARTRIVTEMVGVDDLQQLMFTGRSACKQLDEVLLSTSPSYTPLRMGHGYTKSCPKQRNYLLQQKYLSSIFSPVQCSSFYRETTAVP
eukprot:scpid95450/ scgid17924/ 